MKAQFEQAMGLFQARKFPEAEAQFRQILSRQPGEPNSSRMLGVTLASRGRLEEAASLLEDVVQQAPGFFLAHIDLALVQAQQKKLDEAIATLKGVLKLSPEFSPALSLLKEFNTRKANIVKPGSYGSAQVDERDPVALLRHALWLASNGDTDLAKAAYEKVLVVDPKRHHAYVGLAAIARERDDFVLAEDLLKKGESLNSGAESIRKEFARLYDTMTRHFKSIRKSDEAEQAARKLVQYDTDVSDAWALLGSILVENLNMSESLAAFDKSLEIDDSQPDSHLFRGHVLKAMGQRDACEEAYRRCLDLSPDMGEVWWSLANLKTFKFQASDVQKMEASLGLETLEPANEAHLHFALGKAFEQGGEIEKSFEHYLVGNQIKNEIGPFNMDKFRARCARSKEVFDQQLFAERASQLTFENTPIFIVGLPRSGSTLLEQILASHSQVEGTMELTHISNMVAEIDQVRGRSDGYPAAIKEMDRHDFEAMGKRYMEETRSLYQGSKYFIDKMPNNFSYIGLIKLMLPQAIIIDARRHPVDCCFSNFKQHFAAFQAFTSSFQNLAAYYDIYLDMMSHWTSVLPGQIHLVQHEDLVEDPETTIRELLKHCGLEFEDSCLNFHETDRIVFTASSEQVREPINAKGIGVWRNYEAQLEPLIDLLGGALERYRKG